MMRRPPRSTRTAPLFPYTTLFRSGNCWPFAKKWSRSYQRLYSSALPGNGSVRLNIADPKVMGIITGFGTMGIVGLRSEEHTSELQSLMRISYAVFCLKKKKKDTKLNYQQT